jgi:peptidoglycan/xylan/chitin deacetylase (PgdA/CDA1 family)
MKHALKLHLRNAYARVLWHTGLHALVDRCMPRRLTILMGHCVEAQEHNGHLPRDMKIAPARLTRMLEVLGRRYRFVTVAEGFDALQERGGTSLLALSMDDGYRDNLSALVPVLERTGARATVYLETRPLDERRVNWSHQLFWVLARQPAEAFARRYLELSADRATCDKLRAALERGGRVLYQLKRVLKYEAEPADRERCCALIFSEAGGDERAVCERLYLDWEDARALERAGVELGAHTVSHAILARLDAAEQRAEIDGSLRAIERGLGHRPRTFAYPWGRRWDYDEHSRGLARELGFACAVSSHAGTNDARTDSTQLRRIAIDEDTQLHLVVTEACGGFDLLRRLGLDWSE